MCDVDIEAVQRDEIEGVGEVRLDVGAVERHARLIAAAPDLLPDRRDAALDRDALITVILKLPDFEIADPVEVLAAAGVDAIVNLSASPFAVGKHARREQMLAAVARRHRRPLLYVNQVGGNDGIAQVFLAHLTDPRRHA